MRLTRSLRAFARLACSWPAGCTNDPYPDADRDKKILYSSFTEAPKTLDPAVAYTTAEHIVTGNVFDTLLEYHYLRRPYELIPGLAEAVPKAETQPNGHQSYRFRLRSGILFHGDPCFALSQKGRETREVHGRRCRLPARASGRSRRQQPGRRHLRRRAGLRRLRQAARRACARPTPRSRRCRCTSSTRRAGGIEGVVVHGDLDLEIVLASAQSADPLLVRHALHHADGLGGGGLLRRQGGTRQPRRSRGRHRPVPAGALREAAPLRARAQRGLVRPGSQRTRDAPGAVFPTEIDKDDIEAKRIDPAYAGRRLPFLDEIRFTREKESIPHFNKFLQGYYDDSGIIKESFDAIIVDGDLSPEMKARGMRLDKEVEPTIFYIGFNMEDPVVGAPAGEKGRKLRQAMSLAIDAEEFLRLFLNGRGVPAQSPLPPGIFGYGKDYRNPFRQPDLTRARQLLAEAGYKNGIDPATGQPLKLTFDTGNTTARRRCCSTSSSSRRGASSASTSRSRPRPTTSSRRRCGAAPTRSSAGAGSPTFPDPENFLFLLDCENARSKNNGPNTANFCNAEFDKLYRAMKNLPNDDQRAELIKRMVAILERERPWIELFHRESYVLRHAWVVNAKSMGISVPDLQVQGREARAARAAAGGVERAGALAALSRCCSAIAALPSCRRSGPTIGSACRWPPISSGAWPTAP